MAHDAIQPQKERGTTVRKMLPNWTFTVERVTRIELALSAWEADVLPLNYTRVRPHRLTLPPAWAVSAQTSYRTRWVPRVLPRDRDLKAGIESGRVEPDPYDPRPIQPSSID
jgi:hypothetical protein